MDHHALTCVSHPEYLTKKTSRSAAVSRRAAMILATTRSCEATEPDGQPEETAASGASKKVCNSSASPMAFSTSRACVSPKTESTSPPVRASRSGRTVE
eukprot:5767666-Prymnesium_polylepis.1